MEMVVPDGGVFSLCPRSWRGRRMSWSFVTKLSGDVSLPTSLTRTKVGALASEDGI